MSSSNQGRIKKTLDQLYANYLQEYRRSPSDFFRQRPDPIRFPHRYRTFLDQEAAAFISATFAYGTVAGLSAFVDKLLNILGSSPSDRLKMGPSALEDVNTSLLYYRFQDSAQIVEFLKVLCRVYSEHGSLYQVFLTSYRKNSTMKSAAAAFIATLRNLSRHSLKFLLPSPEDGSTCKRLNLFFRWMVRRDGIDFGLWQEVSPAQLIMPVDTHIGRVAYKFGWIKTPSLTWRKAEEITAVLREFDPDDPTRYDFSLCHESISHSPWLLKELGSRRSPQSMNSRGLR